MVQFSGQQKFSFLKVWCFTAQSIDNFLPIKIRRNTMPENEHILRYFHKTYQYIPWILIFIEKSINFFFVFEITLYRANYLKRKGFHEYFSDRTYNPAGMRCLWEVSQSGLHWERYLRDLSERSQKRCLFCDVFRTSQIHVKKDFFFVTSLRRLKNISKKMYFVWRL